MREREGGRGTAGREHLRVVGVDSVSLVSTDHEGLWNGLLKGHRAPRPSFCRPASAQSPQVVLHDGRLRTLRTHRPHLPVSQHTRWGGREGGREDRVRGTY